ncbi:MAG: hypothetical protein RSE01_09060 [Akkermansia sp.]
MKPFIYILTIALLGSPLATNSADAITVTTKDGVEIPTSKQEMKDAAAQAKAERKAKAEAKKQELKDAAAKAKEERKAKAEAKKQAKENQAKDRANKKLGKVGLKLS